MTDLAPELAAQLATLRDILRRLGSVVVAFSGGVDSAFLLRVAVETLGADKVLAVTGRSPSVPRAELENVAQLAADLGAVHEFVDTGEFDDPRYLANPTNRCFFCKDNLYSLLVPLARQRGLAAVVSGTNADDLGDYRPGLHAADDRGVVAPLAEAAITKAQLRQLAAAMNLPFHDKPASPCLSSRIPYGQPVTREKLERVDQAETFLRSLGFGECRVRHHERLARIEVPAAALSRFADAGLREQIDRHLRGLGFDYVTLDLRGFRSGSLNEVLVRRSPGGS